MGLLKHLRVDCASASFAHCLRLDGPSRGWAVAKAASGVGMIITVVLYGGHFGWPGNGCRVAGTSQIGAKTRDKSLKADVG